METPLQQSGEEGTCQTYWFLMSSSQSQVLISRHYFMPSMTSNIHLGKSYSFTRLSPVPFCFWTSWTSTPLQATPHIKRLRHALTVYATSSPLLTLKDFYPGSTLGLFNAKILEQECSRPLYAPRGLSGTPTYTARPLTL